MPPAPRLSIRIDVDVTHGRAALGAGHPDVPADPLALAAAVEAVRARLEGALVESYPRAQVTVVAQHGWFTARPTRVTHTRRKPLLPANDVECIHVAEHADALRAASVRAVARGTQWAGHAAALDAAAAAADVRMWGRRAGEDDTAVGGANGSSSGPDEAYRSAAS